MLRSAVLLCFFGTVSTLTAQEIAIGIEAIKGENIYELEAMQSADVAVTDEPGKALKETNIWNSPWHERPETPALLSLFYIQHLTPLLDLELGGKAVQFRPEYDFTNYKSKKDGKIAWALPMHAKIVEDNFDLEVALGIKLLDDKLKLRPKAGERKENFRAKYKGIGAGNDKVSRHPFLIAKEIGMDGVLHGPYAGLDVYVELAHHFHFFAGASQLNMRGSKQEYEWEAETLDNGLYPFIFERQRTDAVLTGNIYQGGFVIGLSDHIHVHIGYVHEVFQVSYPGFLNLYRLEFDGSKNKEEFPAKHDAITDALIYGKAEQREKRHVVLGVVFELDFGRKRDDEDDRRRDPTAN